jgi:hypothetical protein
MAWEVKMPSSYALWLTPNTTYSLVNGKSVLWRRVFPARFSMCGKKELKSPAKIVIGLR